MFAVIYELYLKPDKEALYRAAWQKVASYFVKDGGALGSFLHKGAEGKMIAYSQWPSRDIRDASWPKEEEEPSKELPEEIRKALFQLQECMDETREYLELIDSV